jgi:hypothetical protein
MGLSLSSANCAPQTGKDYGAHPALLGTVRARWRRGSGEKGAISNAPGRPLATITPDEKAAIEEAVKVLQITKPEQQKRLIARRER